MRGFPIPGVAAKLHPESAEGEAERMAGVLTVAIGGLGAIGAHLARALDAGVEGLSLVAVAARDRVKAERLLSGFRAPPAIVSLAELAERADVVVEAAPAAV